jgi:hypothetical protein
MGFIEETGAAQHFRDARITTIYEGTTGIQALDLVGRKIARDKGQAAAELIVDMRRSAGTLDGVSAAMTHEAADLLEQAVHWLLTEGAVDAALPGAAAVNALHLFGIGFGAWQAAVAAARAAGSPDPALAEAKMAMAHFYAGQIFPEARTRRDAILGSADILKLRPELFG